MLRFTLKLLVFVFLLVLLGYGVWYSDPAMSGMLDWTMLITNLVPLFFLLAIVYGLTRRIGLSFFMVGLFGWILFLLNEHKLQNLEEPLIFADIYLLPQMITGWELMQQYLDFSLVLVGLVLFIVMVFLLCRFERPGFQLHYGVLVLLVGVSGMVFIVQSPQAPQTYYGSGSKNANPWVFSSLAENQGLLASLVSGARLTRFVRPVFNAQAIDAFLAEHNSVQSASDITELRPDTILWLSESFFDTQVLNQVEPCETWVLFCDLQANGVEAKIGVSTFGGNTTRTEFEVLTGVPFSMLGDHDYPYISVVNNQTQSIVWELLSQGYKTIAIHPHERTFWQRHRALPLLGFQQFDDEDTFKGASRSGYYIADRYLKDRVIKYLNQAEEPSFVFAISMENHGPWGLGDRHGLDSTRVSAIPVPEGLDDEEALAWREYIYHGENSLNELAELYAFVAARERPTLIVFFGDHLPGLNPIFDRLGFKNGRPGPAQRLPVIALANYPLQADWLPRYAHDLGVWTLHLAGQLGAGTFAEMNAALTYLRATEEASPKVSDALEAMQARILATQGTYDLVPVATFRSPHLAERNFCEVVEWGPQVTQVDVAANEQPDGSMGIWIRTDCFPSGAALLLEKNPLQVTRTDFGITTSVSLPVLGGRGVKSLYFYDEKSKKKQLVGQILVE